MTDKKTDDAISSGKLADWMQLVRLPNVFTVLADVGAAFLLVAGGGHPVSRFALVLLGGVCLYWAGMILNDVFDAEKDKLDGKPRPIPRGKIPLGQARTAGWSLLVVGVLLSSAAGYVPAEGFSTTWFPAAVAIALAALVVGYDGPLKQTPIAPAAMGGCRVLSFLLGASPVLQVADSMPVIPRHILAIAFGFGVYIMGLTTMARDEETGGHLVNLRTGFFVMLLGALMLAFAPGLSQADDRAGMAIQPSGQFVVLVVLIVLPVITRGVRAQIKPEKQVIGNTIRAGILTIIPLSAAFALLGAGQLWAIGVFALVIPAIALSMRLQVT